MQFPKLSIDALELHAPLWQRMQLMLKKNRLTHALLFVGPSHAKTLQFSHRLISLLLCESQIKPCEYCQACHLLLSQMHPDIQYVRSDAKNGVIKIEQMRELQQTIYQTPQRGNQRIVLIDPANKLNIAAANALLKILEEPPLHTLFILLAEHMDGVPATIISRCQQYVFPLPEYGDQDTSFNYLKITEHDTEDPERAKLAEHIPSILQTLCHLIDGKITPCTVATEWSSYALEEMLRILYLLTAQAIQCSLLDGEVSDSVEGRLNYLAHIIKPVRLFA